MRWLLRKCHYCSTYTLRDRCPLCGRESRCAHPHRYSPADGYVKYRVLLRYLSTSTS